MDRLINSGKVSRGYLGINIQPLTPDLAKEFNLPDESSGVLVSGVMPDSAAARAGVQDGDVILELNAKKVSDPRTLQLLVSQTAPGTKVTLRILRGEEKGNPAEQTLTVTLAELPEEALARRGQGPPEERGRSNIDALDGVEVSDIDAAARRQFDIPRSVRGALVVNVDPDSAAAQAGLQQGDVLVEINRQPVRGADDAVALSGKAKGDRVLLRVWSRGDGSLGGTRYLVIEKSKPKP